MQEKLLLFILKWQMPVFTKVFLSSLWLFSSLLYMQILTQLPTLPNEIRKSLLPEGSSSASLQVYLPYSITINGLSSPASGSRSQPSYTLNAYLIYSLRKGMASMVHQPRH
jgi:hypothetical protein